jgi:hypothetical protein
LALDWVAVFLKTIFVVVVLCQRKLVFTVLAALKAWEEFQDTMNLILLFNEPYHPLIFHCTLEPNGLSRDDGKRPDRATLIPWSKGQRLIWDVTCVDTLASSYLNHTSMCSGAAAEIACVKKHNKYKSLKSANFIFKALAFETLGPWCKEASSFIDNVGSKLIAESGDLNAKYFLRQCISLAIQRGNAASIRGALPETTPLEEIYFL